MIVICLSAKAESGKTTFANMLQDMLMSNGNKVIRMAFANPLKEYCETEYSWDGKKDEAGRALLQKVGQRMRNQNGEDYWVRQLLSSLKKIEKNYDFCIIDDMRYLSELRLLEQSYGENCISLRLERYDREIENGLEIRSPYINNLTPEQRQHASECELDDVELDYYSKAYDLPSLSQEVNTFCNQNLLDILTNIQRRNNE